MKARNQPLFLQDKNVKIENVWEVLLAPDVWEDVKVVAEKWNTTYSWIVRYCVFRLARRKTLRMFPAMENLIKNIKEDQPKSSDCHRHMLCLYGEDEKMLKLVAMNLDITVSMLIRLALAWFLKKIKAQLHWLSWETKNMNFAKYRQVYDKYESYQKAKKVLRRLRRKITGFSREYLMKKPDYYWYGIKMTAKLELDCRNDYNIPTFRRFYFQKFRRDEWFDMFPAGDIAIPCSF